MFSQLRGVVTTFVLVVTAVSLAEPAAATVGWNPFARPQTVTVDTSEVGELIRHELVGVGSGGSSPAAIAGLEVGFVRFDASLDSLWDCDSGLDPERLTELHDRIETAQTMGAEPLVILSYMPECLAAPGGLGFMGPTRRPPADPDAWQATIEALLDELVTHRIETGRAPVRWFETWNEPDVFMFWDGTPQEFASEVFVPELRAVAAVEARSGVDVELGGCACVVPNGPWIDRLIRTAQAEGADLDFVSWHWYANLPFLGPDGPEPGIPRALFPLMRLIAIRNPFMTPDIYRQQSSRFRRRYGDRPLIVSEWNISAAGWDRRNDTHVGAAFQAATLVSMQRGGLDASMVFNAQDHSTVDAFGAPAAELHGGWGITTRTGARKPAWYAQRFWTRMAPSSHSVSGAGEGVFVAAAGGDSRHTILASAFTALPWKRARTLRLRLVGLDPGKYEVAVERISAEHDAADGPHESFELVAVDATSTFDLGLPAQSVAFISITPVPG